MTSNKEWEDEVMTIEDKAKAYDEAVNKLRRFMEQGIDPLITRADVQDFFPELKESEDEKIRKAILNYLTKMWGNSQDDVCGIHVEDAIAWLEKQGEQKPNPYTGTSFEYNGHNWGMCARDNGIEILFDGELKAFLSSEKSFIYPIHPQPYLAPKSASKAIKEKKVDNQNCIKSIDNVKPKFKVGDWLVHNERKHIIKVVNLTPLVYEVVNILGYHHTITNTAIKNNYHLWTIQDAKDGDVLACENGWTCIFNCLYDNLFNSHCFMDAEGWFCEDGGQAHTLDNRICGEIHPATKEQRDLLFQKMHEAGWEFDFDKKELKKISQRMISAEAKEAMYDKPIDLEKFIIELSKQFPNVPFGKLSRIAVRVAKWAKPTDEEMKELLRTEYEKGRADAIAEMQKPAWSEEDEERLKSCLNTLQAKGLIGVTDTINSNWLKSIKQRIQHL